MSKLLALVPLFVISAFPLAADPRPDFDSGYGFTMDAPAVDDIDQASGQVCAFFLPTEDGFASNINVMKQAYDGTIEEYDTLSLGQFEQLGYTVIQHTLGSDSAAYEYVGNFQGKKLHWYSTAVKVGNAVLLATATGPNRLWEKQGPVLKASVDSLRLKNEDN